MWCSKAELTARSEALHRLLSVTKPLWEPRPFEHPAPPWTESHSELTAFLDALDDDALGTLEADPDALRHALAPWLPTLPAAASLDALPWLGPDPSQSPPTAIPARKAAQIEAFLRALETLGPPAGSAVDWCAGKGHLSRALAERFGLAVRALEKELHLIAAGEHLAEGQQISFEAEDVLARPIALEPGEHLCALHACGGLHDAALQSFSRSDGSQLFLAPCCYALHRPHGGEWRGWARSSPAIQLDSHALRLAAADLATAPAGVRARRTRELVLRQAFDLFQRDTFDRDAYLPCPSMPPAIIDRGFEAFAAQAAAHHGLALPTQLDGDRWMAAGAKRAARVRRRNLLRLAFGRVLELRIVLDRALWLAEQGFAVSLITFCDRALTPRNLLLSARSAQRAPKHREKGPEYIPWNESRGIFAPRSQRPDLAGSCTRASSPR